MYYFELSLDVYEGEDVDVVEPPLLGFDYELEGILSVDGGGAVGHKF